MSLESIDASDTEAQQILKLRISQMSHDQVVRFLNRCHMVGTRGLTKRQALKSYLMWTRRLRQLKAPNIILKNAQRILIKYRYTPSGRRKKLD